MDRERLIFERFFAPCPHVDGGNCVRCLREKRDLLCPECGGYLNIYNLYGGVFINGCRCYTGQSLRRMINVERERRVLEESRARRKSEGRATAGDLNASAPAAVPTEDEEVGGRSRRELRADVHELQQRIREHRDAIRRIEREIEAIRPVPTISPWKGGYWF